LTKVADERLRHRCVRCACRSPWYLEVADALAVGEHNRRITRRHKRIHRNDAELPIVVDEQTPEQRCALMSSTFQRLGEVNWRF
jgi:hypothetical protein